MGLNSNYIEIRSSGILLHTKVTIALSLREEMILNVFIINNSCLK